MMDWTPVHLESLRDALTELYSTETSTRRVVFSAGLEEARFDFHGSSLERWFSVLAEANRQRGDVDAIVRVAQSEYPRNAALAAAIERHQTTADAPPTPTTVQGPKGPPFLTTARLCALRNACIACDLDRGTLLGSLSPRYRSQFERKSKYDDQVLSDLQKMNRDGVLEDGTVPLRVWLDIAIDSTRDHREHDVFVSAHAELIAALGAPPGPSKLGV